MKLTHNIFFTLASLLLATTQHCSDSHQFFSSRIGQSYTSTTEYPLIFRQFLEACGYNPKLPTSTKEIKRILQLPGAQEFINSRAVSTWTPLMYAAHRNNREAVILLIQNGALVDMQNYLGYTALMFASFYGCTDVMEALIQRGADCNLKDMIRGIVTGTVLGNTALHIAAGNNKKTSVQLLLKYAKPLTQEKKSHGPALPS